ncbi:MAG: flagellar basal body-associated FliL family protein [Bdellovibrionales bacterium]|nr:flagellar basal body-associated FliL family protein [Bdellovibrionales bacterium]
MADKAEKKEEAAAAPAESGGGGNNKILLILAAVNIVAILGIGMMVFLSKQQDAEKPTIDQVVEGEVETQKDESMKADEFIGKSIPLETFLVNLAGASGGRLAKISIELEIENGEVQDEIEKRKPQIRDIVIMLLSSKTYQQVSEKEGKDSLRDEIKQTLNSFLTKGEIKSVYFTDFLFQ